jgi:hypothetical protein
MKLTEYKDLNQKNQKWDACQYYLSEQLCNIVWDEIHEQLICHLSDTIEDMVSDEIHDRLEDIYYNPNQFILF